MCLPIPHGHLSSSVTRDAGPGTALWLLARLLGVASIERLGPHTWGGPIQLPTQCTGIVGCTLVTGGR